MKNQRPLSPTFRYLQRAPSLTVREESFRGWDAGSNATIDQRRLTLEFQQLQLIIVMSRTTEDPEPGHHNAALIDLTEDIGRYSWQAERPLLYESIGNFHFLE